ncbi:MAG: preprotein translocase subunit SecE, partial [Pseudomonadota bacterium]
MNPFQFLQEVRQETSKVTWPSRKETWVTTVAVLIMVALAAVFFMLADQLMGAIV